jgi:hypothetical protein
MHRVLKSCLIFGDEEMAKVLLKQVRVRSQVRPEEAIMINLEPVKVTPRDQQVLNLLV